MAIASYSDLVHERRRWRDMSDRQLFRRLQQITKPNKLAAFLHRAVDENRSTLFRDGIDRCNALGLVALERRPGNWDVVSDPIPPLRGPAGEAFGPKSILTKEVMKQVEIESEKPEKKKKSLYSRKLRTKRRK